MQKIKISDIDELITRYRRETTLDQVRDELLKETPHVCIRCKGKGVVFVDVNTYPTNLPDSGWVERIETKEMSCILCGGIGYTKEKFVMQPKQPVEYEYVVEKVVSNKQKSKVENLRDLVW
ncbi:hypothetical protein POP12_090 [Pectobacterium phage POP12]|nr:hypothetical protein POP12_090 [Pectobacterium phage POP12]